MLAIATERLSGASLTRSGNAREPELIQKSRLYSIYGQPEENFVIISSNDKYMPVLAISHTPYKGSKMPDGFKWWLNAITQSMEAGYVGITRTGITPINNFVKTTWGQEDPYNGLCPKIGTSRPPAGCVATAMAQIMNYYQYPAQGAGTGSYTAGGKSKTVTIKNEYRWDRMLNKYTAQSAALSKVAVQYLMADAGAAVNMSYAMSGSGAQSESAAYAFYQNFKYDSLAVRLLNRVLYDAQEWMELVYNELDNQRPILYGGADEHAGGHAFVLSGTDTEGRVYVNWGWDGDADGFYDLADLSPTTSKNSTYNFSIGQDMIIGIIPHESSGDSEDFTSIWYCEEPYNVWTIRENLVEFAILNFFNLHIIPFKGCIDLYFENISGGESDNLILYETEEDEVVGYWYGFSRSDRNLMRDTIDISDLQAGTYRVYVRTKDVREKVAQPLRTIGGASYIEITKYKDGTIVSSSDTIPDPDAIDNPSFNVQRSTFSTPAYDLSGRMVRGNAPLLPSRGGGNPQMKKGLYIMNGKKVLVR